MRRQQRQQRPRPRPASPGRMDVWPYGPSPAPSRVQRPSPRQPQRRRGQPSAASQLHPPRPSRRPARNAPSRPTRHSVGTTAAMLCRTERGPHRRVADAWGVGAWHEGGRSRPAIGGALQAVGPCAQLPGATQFATSASIHLNAALTAVPLQCGVEGHSVDDMSASISAIAPQAVAERIGRAMPGSSHRMYLIDSK